MRAARVLRLAVLALALCALLPNSGRSSASVSPPNSIDAEPSSIIVRTVSPAAFPAVERFAARRGYAVVRSVDRLSALQVALPARTSLARGVSTFLAAPGVVYVEPLYEAMAADIPEDDLFARQRGYLDPVGAPAAWDIETGDPGVIVAILDTGVDVGHPDLAGRIWTNVNEVPGNGIDDDGNRCVDDVNGCAFVSFPEPGCDERQGGAVADDIGHGTFVAGIVAANADGEGIVGVARGATVMPVKVLDCTGRGNSLELADGILWAAENGARVLNISLGGPNNPLIVHEVVRAVAEQYGALVVAAAGNTGEPGVSYPARYAETLAVGAASSRNPDQRASFSTSGPEVDVVAVGEGVLGTVPADSCDVFLPCIDRMYARGDGTSFAAPQIAGLAALMLSRRPGLTPQGIIDAVRATAAPLPPGETPDWAGAGRADMRAALGPAFRLGVPGVARE